MIARICHAGILLIMIGALVSGCAHTISPEVRATADKDLGFPTALQNPAAYIGKTVIWGGVILEVTNRPGGTELIVLETPLDYEGEPRDREYSRGRFIVKARRYLDPEVYQEDRKVTVAGEIVGQETRPLGETRYTYPVLRVRELHLWKEERYRRPYYHHYPYYRWHYWHGRPYHPYYGPFFGPRFGYYHHSW